MFTNINNSNITLALERDLKTMSPKQLEFVRKRCLRSLYCFCTMVMGYADITLDLHDKYCKFLASPSQRKQVTLPRGYVKTWIGSIAYPIWATLPRKEEDEFPYPKAWEDKYWTLGANMRVLIASYVISNAEKMIGLIRKTYERSQMMLALYPETIPPNFMKTKWSNQSACINRPDNFTESTFEAAGIGGASTSRHYDLIIEDDLIYAKKDDFSGQELQPGQDDIDKAIGWHKLVMSLLVPGKHTHIHNAGTRWAMHDLVDYIWMHEPDYEKFIVAAVREEEGKRWDECEPTWPEAFDHTQLKRIEAAQGPYMFSTQYLLKPSSPQEHVFDVSWLEYYTSTEFVPSEVRIFTTVDLAEWGNSSRKSHNCNAVVLTCAWDTKNHCWVLGYDVGRLNPSEMIYLMGKHWKVYHPESIHIESVYYQKALAHFTRIFMEEKKVPWMRLKEVKPEGNVAKEVRIRAIEPQASNHAIHCRPDHKDFIQEFREYIPNTSCKKDILDAMAYQIQVARPGEIKEVEKRKFEGNVEFKVDMDEVLKKMLHPEGRKDRFGNPQVPVAIYRDDRFDLEGFEVFSNIEESPIGWEDEDGSF